MLLAFLRYSNFYTDLFDHAGKQVNKKSVNFKIYCAVNWQKNNCNQDYEIWSIKKIQHKKIFFLKNHAENEAGRLATDLFLFLEALYEIKAIDPQPQFKFILVVLDKICNCTLANCIKFQTVDTQIYSILIFKIGSGTTFSNIFSV